MNMTIPLSGSEKYDLEMNELQKNGYVDEILSYENYKKPQRRYRIDTQRNMFRR